MSISKQVKEIIERAGRPLLRNVGDVGPTMRGKTDDLASHARRSADGTRRVDAEGDPNLKKPKKKPKDPVQEYDVGSYKGLKKREVVGDGMQHDHIPSWAAIKRAKEIELRRKLDEDEIRDLYNNATAVELTDAMHRAGRTWGRKNSPEQIAADAQDLGAAAKRDLEALVQNMIDAGVPEVDIEHVVRNIMERNSILGR